MTNNRREKGRKIKFRFFLPNEHKAGKSAMFPEIYSAYEGEGLNQFIKERQDMEIVVMQYTGLKDKNGKEIYEGDIVMLRDVFLGPVEFGHFELAGGGVLEGFLSYKTPCFAMRLDDGSGYTDLGESCNIRVIGNIWENPELLEKECE